MIASPNYVSIILTTSPIPSHPSTEVIDSAINSILAQPSLKAIHVYIVCDGAKISPQHQNKYKSGIISQQTSENYRKFKQLIKEKYGKQKEKFTIIQRQVRCGFAENIKFLMEEYAKTDYVIIYQHDYIIEKQIPFGEVVEMMRVHPNQINYLSFMNLSYFTIIPKMESIQKVKSFLLKLLNKPQNFNLIENMKEFTQELLQYFQKKFGMPLLPLNFWYDKLHVASRDFYLKVVFNEKGNYDPNRKKNMKTVTFVEDTFGHCMKWTIDEEPQTLMNKFCAYILWDEKPVFRHQSGRSFVTQQVRQRLIQMNSLNKTGIIEFHSQDQEVKLKDFEEILSLQTKKQ